MIVAGIDPSVTNTAVCVGPIGNERICSYPSIAKGQTVPRRIARFVRTANAILATVAEAKPDLIVLEGYAMASQTSHQHSLAEFGGLLRANLLTVTNRIIEVAPATLKKFVTGNGRADKAAIASALTTSYGVTFQSSDEADAFGCWRMALILAGVDKPTNQKQAEAIQTLRHNVTFPIG